MLVCSILGCSNSSFPCTYLGLPLTLRKQSAAQLQCLVDKLHDCLPHWKAAMLPKSGRLTLILSVLGAIPIHSMLALSIPVKIIKALSKICRGFLWCGKKEATGGHCAVAWDSVCKPKWAGGLGIPDLSWLNKALQARWPWLQKTDNERPWAEFNIDIPAASRELYNAASRTIIGNGRSALFWEDRWLSGYRVGELAPAIYNRVRRRTRASRTVKDTLIGGEWARYIGPNLTTNEMAQFLALWQRVAGMQLVEGEEDRTIWSWEQNGIFSAPFAYAANFMGLQRSPTAEFTWKSNAPLHTRFFLWLAIQNRCWTSDRLAKRGLPHQSSCPFCD